MTVRGRRKLLTHMKGQGRVARKPGGRNRSDNGEKARRQIRLGEGERERRMSEGETRRWLKLM